MAGMISILKVHKVFQDLLSRGRAFFGVELDAVEIV